MQSERKKIEDRNYQRNHIENHLKSQIAQKNNLKESDNTLERIFGDNVKRLSKHE